MPTSVYNILLVENSETQAKLAREAVARVQGFRIVSHVPDAVAALTYLRGKGELADRQRFPLPDVVLLNLNAPHCDDADFLQWAQQRTLRPVLAIFSTPETQADSKLAELLQADLFEANLWAPHVFERFMHFAGNIADMKRRGTI